MKASRPVAGSRLLLDEYFRAGDARFLDEVWSTRKDKTLARLAERWWFDERPWARAALLRYIDDGCDRPGHRGLVKRLFKAAEAAGDDVAMAHFAAAFDRLIDHRVVSRRRWDQELRKEVPTWVTVRTTDLPIRQPPAYPLPRFSIYTRQYLQRRALRYFRHLGHRDPARFRGAMRHLLGLYRDGDLERPEQLLASWSLMHVCYWGSPVIERRPRGVAVAPFRKLADLEPAPMHAEAWRDGTDDLLRLLTYARARMVRRWAIALLERDHAEALARPSLEQLRPLLQSPHDEVQIFAVELLGRVEGLGRMTVGDWLELLEIDNPLALPVVCDLVIANVTPDRLSLAQCIALARVRAAPVAELGLGWAKNKTVSTLDDVALVLSLREAECDPVRARAMPWVAAQVLAMGTPEQVRDLVDARYGDARAAGCSLLAHEKFEEKTALWAAATESPYADVRAFVLRHLEGRRDTLDPSSLRHLWITALLAVHRGSRDKRLALRQIAERLADQPAETDELVPLLGLLLRSVRPAERRAALAAIGAAAEARPPLRAVLAQALPELSLPSFDVEVLA